ncbi:MAG: efflux RND transporter periplasmic adaptor subunit [Thermodesulfovibrionales bacterium]|nr:efflux RND transporter periplasmic adaptor subunit [Thermodesulfovibrionales bacterium]
MRKNKIILAICVVIVGGFLVFLSFAGFGVHEKNSDAVAKNTITDRTLGIPAADAVGKQTDRSEFGEDVPTVDIPPDKQQLIGVQITEAALKPLWKTIRTVGRIESDERKITTINIKVEGWVEKLYADFAGKPIKKDDLIADIYSPELVSTQLEFINLLKWKEEKGHRFQRNVEFQWGDRYGTTGQMLTFDIEALILVAKQKMMLWEIPVDQINKIEETKEPVKILTVRSPVNGFILQKPVVKGTRVLPGDKIVDIVDLSSVWIIADIYEPDLPLIKTGQQAKITLSSFPQKTIHSKIDFIYPFLAEATRSVKVRFSVPNPRTELKPQMFTTVEITIDLGKRLAIPESAVLDSGKRQLVYVDKGEGLFEPREIAAGVRANGLVEVLRGLKAGERVASSATFLIDSESKLQGIVQE